MLGQQRGTGTAPPAAADRAQVCLLVLCGLPGAGKTTVARGLVQKAEQDGVDARHVCFDELGCQPVVGVGGCGGASGGVSKAGAFRPEAWQQARQEAISMLQTELGEPESNEAQRQEEEQQQQQVGHQHQNLEVQHGQPQQQQQQRQRQPTRHRLIIADDNMQYRSMRWRCYMLARAAGAAVVLLHLRCSEQLAQLRNGTRPAGERVPDAVISRMAAQFEDPTSDTSSASSGSSWESSCSLEWDSTALQQGASMAALWQEVWKRWGPPAPPPHDPEAAAAAKAAAQAATAASLAHAVDLATRQLLADCMRQLAGAEPQRRAAVAAQLNAARRELLQRVQREAAVQGAADEVAAAASHWAAAYRQQCDAILAAS